LHSQDGELAFMFALRYDALNTLLDLVPPA